jgi:hypothetical protein
MPFFEHLASLPFRVASDPDFLGEIYLIYQAAMHATRAAVYYLPHLDCPALRRRKLQIFMDDDGLPGGDTHHYQLARAFRNIGAHIRLADEDFRNHEDLCRHLDQETAHFEDCFSQRVEERHADEALAVTEIVLRQRPELVPETLRDAKLMAEALDAVWHNLDRITQQRRRRALERGRFSLIINRLRGQ